MVKRGARNGRDDGRDRSPVIRAVTLDFEEMENASVNFHSARRMTARQLKAVYPDGFDGCYLVRCSADRQIAFESAGIIYLAYGMDLIEAGRDVLMVDGDRDGRLSTALVNHGAVLLHDDARMHGIQYFDSSEKLGFDAIFPDGLLSVDNLRRITYIGKINGRLLPALVYSELDVKLLADVLATMQRIELVYASVDVPVVLRNKTSQALYAMSMGRLGQETEDICRELARHSAADMMLVKAAFKLVSKTSYYDSPFFKHVMSYEKELRDLCSIWNAFTDKFPSHEARVRVAGEALALREEEPQLVAEAMKGWDSEDADPDMRRSMELVAAMGMACGIDMAVDALAIGVALEDILPS